MKLKKFDTQSVWHNTRWLQVIGMCAFLVLVGLVVSSVQAQAAYIGLSREQRQSASNVHTATKVVRNELGASIQAFGMQFDTVSSGCYKNPGGASGSCEEHIRTTRINMTQDIAASFIANSRKLADVAKAHGWSAYKVNASRDWTIHQEDATEWLKSDFLELQYKKNINGAHCEIDINAGTIGKGELTGYVVCRQEADATGLQYYPG